MAKNKARNTKHKQRENMKQTITFELYGLIFLAISVIAIVQPGGVGQAFRGVFRFFAGSWDFIIPLLMISLSMYIMWKRTWPTKWNYRWTGFFIIFCALLILSHISLVQDLTAEGRFQDQSVVGVTWDLIWGELTSGVPKVPKSELGGGMIGAILYGILHFLFDPMGTKLIVVFLILIGTLLITGKSYTDILIGCKNKLHRLWKWLSEKKHQYSEMLEEGQTHETNEEHTVDQGRVPKKSRRFKGDAQPELIDANMDEGVQRTNENLEIHDFTDVAYNQGEFMFPELQTESNQEEKASPHKNRAVDNQGVKEQLVTSGDVVAYEDEGREYKLPPYSLLHKQTKKSTAEKSDIASNARKLEQTLESFGVKAKVTQVHRGPAVTRYEVYPDVGVKVSKVVNLTDDIALSLAAKGIRIEAPIPGKSAIGIEVPNEDVAVVTLREVLEGSAYHESSSKLSIALGRDISGEPIVAHLNKMPHMLVAGATGSGKSVCINGIITSILYKAMPHEVKLMMIDPKMVELNVYNGIPHLLAPVVTDPKKASLSLKKVVSEMERRYELFAQSGTRDIEKYNDLIKKENQNQPEAKKPLLPYIVVIIDELADLMMVAPGDVEDAICRLAQMARAAGIHLIIATQRPSVDVITGVIKANIPSRIAFGVSSQADSRTILDMGGAEKLLGRGDMLFLPVGSSKALRIQGAFLSDEEVEQVVSYCIEQQKAKYHEDMIPADVEESSNRTESEDSLYQDAVDLVVQHGSASVSMLQRRFRVGYTRAARLIDAMEDNGVVGPYEGSKPREVLISKEQSHIS